MDEFVAPRQKTRTVTKVRANMHPAHHILMISPMMRLRWTLLLGDHWVHLVCDFIFREVIEQRAIGSFSQPATIQSGRLPLLGSNKYCLCRWTHALQCLLWPCSLATPYDFDLGSLKGWLTLWMIFRVNGSIQLAKRDFRAVSIIEDVLVLAPAL